MTTATGLGPLPELLEIRESPKAVRKLFAAEGIPLALIEDRQQRLPLGKLARLFQRAAQQAGDWRFGLDVGLAMAPGEYGLWARYAMQAPTLGGAISRIVETLHLHQSGTVMRVTPRPDGCAAWEYWCPGAGRAGMTQHTDHVVPVMIRFAQAYLGPDWTPLRVEVAYPSPRRATDLEGVTGTSWVFGGPCLAILMTAAALRATRAPDDENFPSGPLLSHVDVVAARTLEATHAPVADIASTVALRLLEGNSDIDGAACLLNIGSRTIQRRLEEQGLTYRSLVAQIRMGRAKSLIEGTDAPLKRIGLELGYNDPAHFTRAFCRYFGYPPSRLRDR
jgi:hypothetical protein